MTTQKSLKKTCNVIYMKLLVHSIEFTSSLFFTQINRNNPRRGCICIAQYALRFFSLHFEFIK